MSLNDTVKPVNVKDIKALKKIHKLQKANEIPKQIIKIFNDLILDDFTGNQARVMQDEVVAKIIEVMVINREEIFDNHWLDIEPVFEEAGWKVTYDKPPYNEDYEASWRFEMSAD